MAIRQIIYKDNSWSKGFLFASLLHWLIILFLIWLWTTYQESETITEAKFCLVVDKQPIIQQVKVPVVVEKIKRIIQRIKVFVPQHIPAPEPVKIELPPVEEQGGGLEDERKRLARAYIEKLNIKLQANKIYPELARRRGQEGTVKVQFDIEKRGDIINRKIISSSGYSIIDKAALNTIQRISPLDPVPQTILDRLGKDYWRFKVPIKYTLDDQ